METALDPETPPDDKHPWKRLRPLMGGGYQWLCPTCGKLMNRGMRRVLVPATRTFITQLYEWTILPGDPDLHHQHPDVTTPPPWWESFATAYLARYPHAAH